MATYVRFETPYRCPSSHEPLGIFRAAGWVEDCASVPQWTRQCLIDALVWFNKHLPVPRLEVQEPRAVFWFRPTTDLVREVWPLVTLLRDEGVAVELRRTTQPGRIVYDDDYQIAAIPYAHGRRKRRRLPVVI